VCHSKYWVYRPGGWLVLENLKGSSCHACADPVVEDSMAVSNERGYRGAGVWTTAPGTESTVKDAGMCSKMRWQKARLMHCDAF
jgi:hypothetical protein